MRDKLAPIIEGFDLSGIVNRYSFECEPFFTDASDSQTMLDGSTVHDVFPVKARFSWTLNSISAEQYAALNTAFARDIVTAQIFDPTINAVRLARFHVTPPAFVYNFTTRHYMSTAGSVLILEDAAPRTLSAVMPATRQIAAPRDTLAPVIEGFDLSGIVNRWSFRRGPFQTEGDNGGTLLDGSTVHDILASKVRLSWRLNAISAQRYADLCAVLSSGSEPDTVSACVYDPAINARYTARFHVTLPVFRFAFDNGQCMAFADSVLVLEEAGGERTLISNDHIIAGDDDWTLYDDGTLEIPEGSDEPEVDRWRRILDDLDNPDGSPNNPIHDVDRIVLKPGVPLLPPGVLDQFPNLEEIVIPPDVEIDPDAFDDCPNLTIIKIVSFPFKSDYVVGEPLDYNGLRVVEIFNGAERDITPECALLPAEGYTTTEAGDIMVDVRYHDKSLATFWVQVTEALNLRAIYVAKSPRKYAYDFGQTLDYSGIVVHGVRTDNTVMDVTSFCTFSPKIGETIPYPSVENPNLQDYRVLPINVQCAAHYTTFNVGASANVRHRTAGTSRISRLPQGNFDTFVSKFVFRNDHKDAPLSVFRWVEFEYKLPGSDTYQNEIRFIQVTKEEQTIYHVVQISEAVPLQDIEYNIYMYEPGFTWYESKGRMISFDSFFMAFPYTNSGGETISYPGSPELVRNWLVRTSR